MDKTRTLLGSVDPELAERLVSRRDALRKGATMSAGLAAGLKIASIPVALAAYSRAAFGQGSLPANIKAVLDFALILEIFENEFYKAVLGTSAVAAQNTAFATVRAAAAAVPGAVPTLQLIQQHEAAHVAFLQTTGATNDLDLDASNFDFTGGRGSGSGPFLRATTELPFLLLTAQAAEDTGVRAYKGQAGNLITSSVVLEAALRIHSVEARHASRIRRMRRLAGGADETVRLSGTIRGGGLAAAGAGNISNPPAGAVAALTAIYGGAIAEGNTTHAGVNAATLPNLPSGVGADAASEAFDEPLTKAEVTAIVQPFFIPDIPA